MEGLLLGEDKAELISSLIPLQSGKTKPTIQVVCHFYRGQPKAGIGYKMLPVPFVFSMSRFQGPAFRCDKIIVIVTLLEAIEGIPDKDCNFLGNEKFQETSSWAKT